MNQEIKIRNYRIKGYFKEKDEKIPFTKEFRGINEEDVKEKVYLKIGSNHKVKRRLIYITEVKEISKDEITDRLLLEFASKPDIAIRR